MSIVVTGNQTRIVLAPLRPVSIRINTNVINGGGGSGTVTSVGITGNDGITVSGSPVTTSGSITLDLGAITPASVAAVGTVTGSNLSGTNTGDQTITLSGDVTGSGTAGITTTIANDAVTTVKILDSNVTLAKIADASANSKLVGSGAAGIGNPYTEITVGSGLTMTGTTLSANAGGVGTVTDFIFTNGGGFTGNVATSTTTPTLSLTMQDAVADGATKGIATFTAADFNSAAGVISIDYTNGQAASAVAKGFLTSADWTTFNNKGSGTVTDVTGASPIASTGGATPAISIQVATAGQNGYLSSADWSTFNSKQNALTITDLTSTDLTVVNGTGAVIGAAPVTLTIANDAVTYAKIQNVTDARLLGRSAGSSGDVQEITVGSGLSLAAGALTATGGSMAIGGTVTSGTAGSVLFVATGPVLAQDNNHFFWDDANDRLTVGSGATGATGSSTVNVTSSTGGETAITLEYIPGGAGTIADAVTMRLALKSSTTANRDAGAIVGQWSDAADATRTSFVTVQTAYNGGSNTSRIGFRHTTATATTASISAEVTNAGLALVPNGTGALTTRIPDGSAGGNARGNNAIDLQTDISANTQVASGTGAVAIGRRNSANNDDAVAIGRSNNVSVPNGIGIGLTNSVSTGSGNIAIGDNNASSSGVGSVCVGSTLASSGAYSLSTGFEAVASLYGQNARANGKITTAGDAQKSFLIWRCQTTDATPEEMFLDGASVRSAIASNRLWTFKIFVSALRDDASEGAGYEFTGCIRNDAGAVALVGTVLAGFVGEDDATWDAAVTADNTNDALVITVTGANAKNINWVASGWLTEVGV